MPTAIPQQQKTNFINIVKVRYPLDAAVIEPKLINYEDIIFAIRQQLDIFASYNSYLVQAMSVFTDSALVAVGIYLNKTTTTLTNPVVLINTTCSVGINITTTTLPNLILFGTSSVVTLSLATNSVVNSLYVGSGSLIQLINGTNPTSAINLMSIKFLRNSGGEVTNALNGTVINQISTDTGATFGGFVGANPLLTCAKPVTDLHTNSSTIHTIELYWTLPDQYLFINIYFKLSTDTNYTFVSGTNYGDYINDSGFLFTGLAIATTYNFRINTTCINGGISANVEVNGTTAG